MKKANQSGTVRHTEKPCNIKPAYVAKKQHTEYTNAIRIRNGTIVYLVYKQTNKKFEADVRFTLRLIHFGCNFNGFRFFYVDKHCFGHELRTVYYYIFQIEDNLSIH